MALLLLLNDVTILAMVNKCSTVSRRQFARQWTESKAEGLFPKDSRFPTIDTLTPFAKEAPAIQEDDIFHILHKAADIERSDARIFSSLHLSDL